MAVAPFAHSSVVLGSTEKAGIVISSKTQVRMTSDGTGCIKRDPAESSETFP